LRGCAPRRRTPRKQIQNSVLSIYQPHTKKGFYEDHFGLYHKVIESREKFPWPRLFAEDVVEMTSEQLHWLMDGYDVWSRPHKPVSFMHVT
jgi:IS66 Orf2 like protein